MTTVDLPRPDVPAPIAVVRDFVNTTDHETGTDDLTTRAALIRHLVGRAADRTGRASADDLAVALRLRAGLRRALELNHDGEPGPVDGLDAVLQELPVALAWTDGQVTLRPAAGGVRGALAGIGLAAHDAATAEHLVAAQDLRLGRVRVGLLRPLEEPVPQLLRVRLRQQAQDPRLPGRQRDARG